MSRDHCTWKNNGLCSFEPHAHMVVPSSFAALQAPVIVIQGLVTL
jgi:hypothetical protein